MSYVYRYIGAGQDLVVRSDERRWDLEEWAYWERVDGVETVAASADPVGAVVEDAPVEVPIAEGEHVLAAEAAVEVAEPVVEKPKRRTRARKVTEPEAED